MKAFRLVLLLPLIASNAGADAGPRPPKSAAAPHKRQTTNAAPANSPVVYVSDFELDVFRGKPERSGQPRTSPSSTSSKSSGAAPSMPRTAPSSTSSNAQPSVGSTDSQREDTPTERAQALVNAMSESLVKTLEKAGYTVRRLRPGDARPATGLRIRGVFAEADEQNRVRRLLVGSDSVTPKMLLYVGVNNLARPEQPLYELANPPSNDSRHGPVITLTSYSPAARFEMSKNATEEDFKKIASEIAADLSALLNANPLTVAQ